MGRGQTAIDADGFFARGQCFRGQIVDIAMDRERVQRAGQPLDVHGSLRSSAAPGVAGRLAPVVSDYLLVELDGGRGLRLTTLDGERRTGEHSEQSPGWRPAAARPRAVRRVGHPRARAGGNAFVNAEIRRVQARAYDPGTLPDGRVRHTNAVLITDG